jgi:hypothetical protein
MPVIKDRIPKGSRRWFEYHCWESESSSDAELWHHSHQRVTVGTCTNPEYGRHTQEERYEDGCPLAYRVVFKNGYKAEAMEDELLTSRKDFERPDPPKRKKGN